MGKRIIVGLNRTSVGLKLLTSIGSSGSSPGPQSNQRGIETEQETQQMPQP